MLYVFDKESGQQRTHLFEKQLQITADVCRVLITIDSEFTVEAVLKKKEKFSARGDPLQQILEILDAGESTIFKENSLHSYLAEQFPQQIVPLFAETGYFTYIISGKKLVPVKISLYCAKEVDRKKLKLAQNNRLAGEEKVSTAIDNYCNGQTQKNRDWCQIRNVIYSNGKCLFHDFDLSV